MSHLSHPSHLQLSCWKQTQKRCDTKREFDVTPWALLSHPWAVDNGYVSEARCPWSIGAYANASYSVIGLGLGSTHLPHAQYLPRLNREALGWTVLQRTRPVSHRTKDSNLNIPPWSGLQWRRPSIRASIGNFQKFVCISLMMSELRLRPLISLRFDVAPLRGFLW